MDVAEIKKLDSYLKRLFGLPRIRVVPRPQRDDYAEVLLDEEPFGRIIVDDEDDERSYNFEKSIQLEDSKSTKLDNETVAKLNIYLEKHLGKSSSCGSDRPRATAPTCTRATSSSVSCSPRKPLVISRSRWRSWNRISSRNSKPPCCGHCRSPLPPHFAS